MDEQTQNLDVCPRCGSARSGQGVLHSEYAYTDYGCNTRVFDDGEIVQHPNCKDAQIATLTAKLEVLKDNLKAYEEACDEVSKVYCELTNYHISKPETRADVVLQEVEECYNEGMRALTAKLDAMLTRAETAERERDEAQKEVYSYTKRIDMLMLFIMRHYSVCENCRQMGDGCEGDSSEKRESCIVNEIEDMEALMKRAAMKVTL